jgi:FkbM family methyltransferase
MTDLEQIRDLVNRTLVRTHINAAEEWVRSHRGCTVLDIGTNRGGFIPSWLENGADVVHAFEPVPMWVDEIKKRFGGHSRVIINQVAISDRIGFHEGMRILNCHTLGDPSVVKLDIALEDTGGFSFSTTTVDDYVASKSIREIGLIKLDVDGYEPAAVRGMANTLKSLRPMLMIELSFLPIKLGESVERMVSQIYDLEYKLCTMNMEVCDDPLVVMEAFPWRTSFDMVAVPNEHITQGHPRIR